MLQLNLAVATAMVEGPRAGLAKLDALASDARLVASHRVDAVRAHLLERAGDSRAAVEWFRRAAEKTTSLAERDYLLSRAARHEP